MVQAPLTEKLGDEQLELVMLTSFEPADAYDLDAERRYATLMCSEGSGRHGGTGTVREAYSTAFEHIALKTMSLPNKLLFREDEYEHELSMRLSAFREEYETLLKLRVMRAFPTVHGYGMLDDAPAIVMGWIEGTSLDELKGSLTTAQVAKLARATFFLLEQVENQVSVFVHRDLAPSNIIIRTSNRSLEEQLQSGIVDLCLVDLGSTTVARETGKSFTSRVGALRGATPAYAAPEMLSLESEVELRNSPKVDVYAVSSVMWEQLTGLLPYDENSVDGLIRFKRESAPAVPADLDEDAAKLARILAKGMDPSQETRPTSHDMRVWLEDLLADKPGFWDGTVESTPLITRRNLLIGAGIAAAAGGIAIIAPRLSDMLRSQNQTSVETTSDLPGFGHDAPHASLENYKGPLLPCLSAEGTWGYISTNAEWAVLPYYQVVNYFSGGLAAVQSADTGLYGYIDAYGNEVIPLQYFDAQPFGQASLAAVQDTSGNWGFINREGRWVIKPEFAEVGEFTEMASARGRDSNLWGFIDKSGNWIVEPRFGSADSHERGAGSYRYGLAPVLLSDGTWTYMRVDGSLVEDQVFAQAGEFFEGYARVAMKHWSEHGYFVDAMFDTYGSDEYTDVGRVSQGMFAARRSDGTWGFGEVSGWRITIPAAFSGVGRFIQGLALARDAASGRWGYIDMLGNWVVRPIMSGVQASLTFGGGITS